MDKIIGYSDDELVVKILSFLPTKVAVSTSVLSKLEYDDTMIRDNGWKRGRMRCFIAKNIHSFPVIESLCLNLCPTWYQPEDIKSWVEIVVSRCLRELSICYFGRNSNSKLNALLPSSLYTSKSLVTLKLDARVRVDDVPRVVCLPCLITLRLCYVNYANEESLQRLLSNCSVLEDLIVKRRGRDNVRKLAVTIPSLLSLYLEISSSCACDGYVIDTPCLKYFKVWDFSQTSSCFIVNMPKLEEADIALHGFLNVKKLFEPVTSVKCLSNGILNLSSVIYMFLQTFSNT